VHSSPGSECWAKISDFDVCDVTCACVMTRSFVLHDSFFDSHTGQENGAKHPTHPAITPVKGQGAAGEHVSQPLEVSGAKEWRLM